MFFHDKAFTLGDFFFVTKLIACRIRPGLSRRCSMRMLAPSTCATRTAGLLSTGRCAVCVCVCMCVCVCVCVCVCRYFVCIGSLGPIQTPIWQTAVRSVECLQLLLASKDINVALVSTDEETALHVAARTGDIEVALFVCVCVCVCACVCVCVDVRACVCVPRVYVPFMLAKATARPYFALTSYLSWHGCCWRA
jgi:hypothetical protein